ncbi:MAG: hypothetical protein ABL986_18940 [Vicinamibacterales bacterium]
MSELHATTAEREEVVDERLILHALVWSPVVAVHAAFRAIAILAINIVQRRASVREVIAAAVLATVFEHIFRPCLRHRTLLLTSNSFSTEALRWQQLLSSTSDGVLEIQHGVPTVALATYLETTYQSARRDIARPAFIAQLPGLGLSGPLSHLMDGTRAINTYFNRRLTGWNADEDALAERVESLLGCVPDTAGAVVAIIGGTAFEADYRTSAAFALECQLMAIIRESFAQHGRSCLLVYSPHPANTSVAFDDCQALRHPDIRVQADSVLSWLTADLCVGLYSSGLFEARYLGVRTFAPLKISDEIFDEHLLAMLSTVDETESRLTAARVWAAREARVVRTELLLARASRRLNLLRAVLPADPEMAQA